MMLKNGNFRSLELDFMLPPVLLEPILKFNIQNNFKKRRVKIKQNIIAGL